MTNTRPLIGVTVSEIRPRHATQQLEHGEPAQTEMTLGMSYMRAVELANAIPVAIAPLMTADFDSLLGPLSALIITGGPDLSPSCYGAEADPDLGPTNIEIDHFELALCVHADRHELPILGICRGAQILNVARGGTLHQDLPKLTDGSVAHRQDQTGAQISHAVRVSPDSDLAQITGGGEIQVNSFHHQAVDRIGKGLRAVAWSVDGVIEAIEDTDRGQVLGVQWHAETLVDKTEQLALFERLVRGGMTTDAHEDSDARSL